MSSIDDTHGARALAAARGLRPGGEADGRDASQLRLFAIPGGRSRRSDRRPHARRSGRNARMAARLDEMAAAAERDAAAARRQGNAVEERRARDRARDAGRAAAMLRAGPSGVGEVLAS